MITEFNKYNDFDKMKDFVKYLKSVYSDYEEVQYFVKDICNEFNQGVQTVGFGVTANYGYYPIMDKMSKYLINNDFDLNVKELEKNHMSLFFSENLKGFDSWMKRIDNPKKYWYFRIPKSQMFNDEDKYTPDEKVKFVEDYFEVHQLSKDYDISVGIYVSYVDVVLESKTSIKSIYKNEIS